MRNIDKRRTLKDSIIKSFAVSLAILFVTEVLIYLGCRELYYSRLQQDEICQTVCHIILISILKM